MARSNQKGANFGNDFNEVLLGVQIKNLLVDYEKLLWFIKLTNIVELCIKWR